MCPAFGGLSSGAFVQEMNQESRKKGMLAGMSSGLLVPRNTFPVFLRS
jgi:hypothetical protein